MAELQVPYSLSILVVSCGNVLVSRHTITTGELP
jgi:hypothetical protein